MITSDQIKLPMMIRSFFSKDIQFKAFFFSKCHIFNLGENIFNVSEILKVLSFLWKSGKTGQSHQSYYITMPYWSRDGLMIEVFYTRQVNWGNRWPDFHDPSHLSAALQDFSVPGVLLGLGLADGNAGINTACIVLGWGAFANGLTWFRPLALLAHQSTQRVYLL